MDSICNDLILVIFQFVPPKNRVRFIKMGQRYFDIVHDYITSPEWIYGQIDQFIKCIRIRPSLRYDRFTPTCSELGCDLKTYHDTRVHFDTLMGQQLGIDVATRLYEHNNFECCVHECEPKSPGPYGIEKATFIQVDSYDHRDVMRKYQDRINECTKKYPDASWFVCWTGKHMKDIHIFNTKGLDECVSSLCITSCRDGIIPLHSIYETIGIIVRGMTGIEQIHMNLLDYDISHLQLFYVVDFMETRKITALLSNVRNTNAMRYDLFVERVLQKHINMDVEPLILLNRTSISSYVFAIHSEIESKAAEVAKYFMMFDLE
jgi:hypothetical protein